MSNQSTIRRRGATILIKAAIKGGAWHGLFDEAPSAPVLPKIPTIKPPKPPKSHRIAIIQSPASVIGSLFDELEHPRANVGTEYNPETGKTSKPGQFKTKPKTEDEDANLLPGMEDVGSGLSGPSVPAEPSGQPTEDARGVRAKERAARRSDSSAGDIQPVGGNDDTAGREPEGSASRVEEAVPVAADRSGRTEADRFTLRVDVEPLRLFSTPNKTGLDFRITDDSDIGRGSEGKKFADNIAAIRLLHDIQDEERTATPEEQEVLAHYTGWGWAGQLFHKGNESETEYNEWDSRHQYEKKWNRWKKDHDELKELLTPEEWEAAKGSTVNAHYTSPQVIDAMWSAVERLGFKGGRVLEPAAGVGNFFGRMPSAMWANSPVTGIELDNVSGAILGQLYQSADVRVEGFEKANLPDNFYDLAISNVPFGNYGIADPVFDKPATRFLRKSIHNYFFAKALTKVRPGGLIAFVTSSFTMDAKTADKVREYLGNQADLVGAVRLPNDAFKENAGTEVTTDIIILRKRGEGESASSDSWKSTQEVTTPEGPTQINEYFGAHPDMMLGNMTLQGTMYADKSAALKSDGRNMVEALAGAVEKLPEGVYEPVVKPEAATKPLTEHQLADNVLPIDSFTMQGGKLCTVDVDESNRLIVVPSTLTGVPAARAEAMIPIRDTCRRLLAAMTHGTGTEEGYALMREDLNKHYDDFVSKFGIISSTPNLRGLSKEPDLALLCALEKYDRNSGTATKADIFTKTTVAPERVRDHADSSQQAMLIALEASRSLDWNHMSKLTGLSPEQLQADLSQQGLVYHNPTGDWETKESYLSGDVRKKLAAAEAAAKVQPHYQSNVDVLREVQPKDLTPGDIDAKLGASWIAPSIIEDFIHHLVGLTPDNYSFKDYKAKARYLAGSAMWMVDKARWGRGEQWSTPDFDATELATQAMNMKQPKVYYKDENGNSHVDTQASDAAQQKQQEIKDEFKTWLWSDPTRAEALAKQYNTEFNNLRKREFDGQHLNLDGLSLSAQTRLNGHIKNTVWRMLQEPNTLIDHCVGAGKSWVQACGAMEMRRLGLAKKPLLTVPNHLLGQTCDTMRDLYPNAHILQATVDDLKKENRQKFMAKIATGDWDAVVMTHSMFGRIGLSADTERAFFEKQIHELDDCLNEVAAEEGGKSKTAKELVKQRKRLEEKLETRMQRHGKLDQSMPFEQLGVDQLLVDEAHMYKNLFMATKMQRVKGLPNTESQRAFDMYMKVQHIQHVNNGGGVRFLTGTPITNTMAEMFTMQRYLQPQWLADHNMSHFDAWAQNFGDYSNSVEYTVAGKMKPTTRFNHFTNVPELAAAYNQFADTKTSEQLKLKLPKANRFEVACEPSPEQTDYVRGLGARAEALSTGQIDPRIDNMLKITSDGRKCSLDARLINPSAPDFAGGKINRCIENVVRIHKDTTPRSSTQCIFLDLSTPKSAPEGDRPEAEVEGDTESDTDTGEEKGIRDSVYQEMKRKLVAKGIPEHEIAFIHDAKTDAQKAALFTKMNKGEVRVLLGSTEKMGTGMNAQNKMYALHHLDCPWRPDMLEQREGRIIRQGNENMDGVEIYNYATKGEGTAMSMDAFMWQTVESKARAIAQVKNGDPNVRTIEDIGDMVLTASQMKALASGNPLLKEHVDVSNQYKRLLGLQKEHDRSAWENQSKLQSLPASIKRREMDIESKRANQAAFEQNKPVKFAASLSGRQFDSSTEAGDMIMLAAKDAKLDTEDHLGNYAGFEILLTRDKLTGNPALLLQNPKRKGTAASIDIASGDKPAGLFTRINNKLSQFGEQANALEQQNAADDRRIKEITGLSAKFPHLDKMHQLEKRLGELDAELQLDKDAPVNVEETSTPAEQRAEGRDARATSSKPASGMNTYHVWNHVDGKYKQVTGTPVTIQTMPDMDVFVAKDPDDDRWRSYEGKSGLTLGVVPTRLRTEAIANLEDKYRRLEYSGMTATHTLQTRTAVQKHTDEHGMSPRHSDNSAQPTAADTSAQPTQNYGNADGAKPEFHNGWEYKLNMPDHPAVTAKVVNIPGITDEVRVTYMGISGYPQTRVVPKDWLSKSLDATILIKAVQLKINADGSRTMTGHASQQSGFDWSQNGTHGVRMAAPLAAIQGLGEVKTRYQAPTETSPLHTYGHSITHGNPLAAAQSTRAKMAAAGHTVTPIESVTDSATGLSHHTFAAHSGNVQHVFRIHQAAPGPSIGEKLHDAASAVSGSVKRAAKTAGAAAAKLGSSAAKIAVHAAKGVKKEAPIEDPTHTAAIYDASSKIKGLQHARTDVNAAGQNHVKEKTDRNYTHYFAHSNPQVSARRMSAVLAGQGHRVSGIAQRKVYMPDASIRHQYSFSSTPAGGGPSHTVNVYRS